MVTNKELNYYLAQLLDIYNIKDYCPNGLQVEGNKEIKKIVTGVTACEELIKEAININADTILVHHGYFWKGEDSKIIGMKKNRISKLLKNDINLFAYHLPLDVHNIYGNNICLAKKFNLQNLEGLRISENPFTINCETCGVVGELEKEISIDYFTNMVSKILNRKSLLVKSEIGKKRVKKIAICTGGAQDFIEYAKINHNADVYISGEISERTTHFAREMGIHFIAGGHHATEKYGVKALGNHLGEKFNLEHIFINIENPA